LELPWQQYYSESQTNLDLNVKTGLYGMLRQQCIKTPESVAIEYEYTKISYRQLFNYIDDASEFFSEAGIKSGDTVGILVRGIPASVIAPYAFAKIGVVMALIHSEIKSQRFVNLINTINCNCIVMNEEQFFEFRDSLKDTPVTHIIICSEDDYMSPKNGLFKGLFSKKKTEYDLSLSDSDIKVIRWREMIGKRYEHQDWNYEKRPHNKPFYIFNNGKSDDGSKALKLSGEKINKAALINSFLYKDLSEELGRPIRVLTTVDRSYLFGFNFGIHTVLITGNTICLCNKYDGLYPQRRMPFYKPDVFNTFPSVISNILRMPYLKNLNFRFLKRIHVGAGVLSFYEKNIIIDFLRQRHSDADIYEFTIMDETQFILYQDLEMYKDGANGIPLPGVLVKIIDTDSFTDVPVGKTGELFVYTPAIFDEYLYDNNYEYNFRHLRDGREWFRTGIIGSMDETGKFYIASREQRRYEIAGSYVYPEVVENEINGIFGVYKCCVVVVPDRINIPYMIAEIIPNESYILDNSKLSELKNTIEQRCKVALPPHMCPSEICFRAYFPEDHLGNIDYKRMTEQVISENLENWDREED